MFKDYEQFLNENDTHKEEFEKECTHYISKDIPGKEKYTGHLVQIKDDFGRGNPRAKAFENKIIVRDSGSTTHHNLVIQFNMSDEDVEKYFKPITQSYLASKKYGLR
jgi:hypothetical protein